MSMLGLVWDLRGVPQRVLEPKKKPEVVPPPVLAEMKPATVTQQIVIHSSHEWSKRSPHVFIARGDYCAIACNEFNPFNFCQSIPPHKGRENYQGCGTEFWFGLT